MTLLAKASDDLHNLKGLPVNDHIKSPLFCEALKTKYELGLSISFNLALGQCLNVGILSPELLSQKSGIAPNVEVNSTLHLPLDC